MFQIDPAVAQSQQYFERQEIDLSGTFNTLQDGRRYKDYQFQGDSIYIPPESAAVATTIYINEFGSSGLQQSPIMYPGGNIMGAFQRIRVVFPASGTGTVILILSRNMKFSSGSILLNAPAQVPDTPDGDYIQSCIANTQAVVVAAPGTQTVNFPITLQGPGYIDYAGIYAITTLGAGAYADCRLLLQNGTVVQPIAAASSYYSSTRGDNHTSDQSGGSYFPIPFGVLAAGAITASVTFSLAGTYHVGCNIYARCTALS